MEEPPVEPIVVHLDLPPFEKFLSRGASGLVFAIDNDTVLKTATGFPESIHEIDIEKRVYDRIGHHPCIVKCVRMDSGGIVLERLLYPLRKRLVDLHENKEVPSDTTILRWSQQITQGIAYLHAFGILQADLGCHNILLDKDDNTKICDFAGAAIDGEQTTVCYDPRSQLPGERRITIQTEIFALGTALYELSTTSLPYPDIDPHSKLIGQMYAEGRFPDTNGLLLADIILRCWNCGYDTVDDVNADLQRLQIRRQVKQSQWNRQGLAQNLIQRAPRYVLDQLAGNFQYIAISLYSKLANTCHSPAFSSIPSPFSA